MPVTCSRPFVAHIAAVIPSACSFAHADRLHAHRPAGHGPASADRFGGNIRSPTVLGGVLAWLVVAESGLHHGRPRRPNHSGVIGLLRLLLCKCRIGAISSLSPLTDIFVLQSTSVPIRVDNVPQTFRIRDIPEVFDLFPHMFNTADGLGDCMVWSGADWERTHADHVFMFRENVYGYMLRPFHQVSVEPPDPVEFASILSAINNGRAVFDFVR